MPALELGAKQRSTRAPSSTPRPALWQPSVNSPGLGAEAKWKAPARSQDHTEMACGSTGPQGWADPGPPPSQLSDATGNTAGKPDRGEQGALGR